MSSSSFRLLVKNATQVVLVCRNGEKYLTGNGMQTLAVVENGSVVIGHDGLIKAVGSADIIESQFKGAKFDNVLDASGMCVLPGLVDAHTHPVWAGDRVHEFAMKLAGATYMEVHEAGGGIHFTVAHTRSATQQHLLAGLQSRLERMMRAGTTLVECKSGYGLEMDTELKMLRVINSARKALPIGISATYCGAHAVPKGKTMEEATQDIVAVQLPEIKKRMASGDLQVDNIDVFCEKGVFDLNSTRCILQAGKDMGLNINFHGDELHPMNSAHLGAELGALAISHLEEVTDDGIAAMANAKTSAVLLPTTAYILRLSPPRARDMLDAGVIVALGSDFNPNAYCCSMPMVMHLACVMMKMSMPEALAASTINAAYALNRSQTHGSLEIGKQGDLVIINAPRWEHLVYQFGGHQELIKYVIIKGEIVHENKKVLTL
ncbi:probable imidazolonepropionase [Rhinichthys klamathensis goyatoka]|uniref:probable imidazolonepropionase n=1 Tax=Rhinichthys klamathensis goyatoka TaxID=3034132 RepID=UPI0024B4EE02|nr:probable imidazolonepropionase [Rhinichthys klamathensis goyatoka]